MPNIQTRLQQSRLKAFSLMESLLTLVLVSFLIALRAESTGPSPNSAVRTGLPLISICTVAVATAKEPQVTVI